MLIPKKITHKIYERLFEQGVMTAKKDTRPSYNHPDPELNVLNLYVIKTMQSLKSRGYVREQFAWRSFYWFLTNEGISYLRDVLHLPAEIVPATLKRHTRTEASGRPGRPGGDGGEPGAGGEMEQDSRRAYRRGPPASGGVDSSKEAGLAGGQEVRFSAGYGRGKPSS